MRLLLLGEDGYSRIVNYDDTEDKDIHTNKGVVRHEDIRVGRIVKTSKGYRFLITRPSVRDIVQNIKGGAKPIYEYHSGMFGAMMGLQPGKTVLESGTGSAGSTLVFASMCYPGKVYSFEREERFYEVARKNVVASGLDNIVLFNEDVSGAVDALNGRGVDSVDAIFLDLQDPENRIEDLSRILANGGFFGVYTPVFDSVTPVWREFERLGYVGIRAIALTNQRVIVKKYTRFDQEQFGFPGFFVIARKFGGV